VCAVRRTQPGPAGTEVLDGEQVGRAAAGRPTAERRLPSRRRVRVDPFLAAAVAVATVLRFWKIGSRALWYDELSTAWVVRVRLVDLLAEIKWREGTPPLYFVSEWVWIRVFGRGDAALRAPSALVGVLTVVVVYALVVELRLTRRTARIAALLVAFNPLLIWYSREARAYSLFAFLVACSLLCLARALRRHDPLDHLLWGLVAVAAFATHYFAPFVLIPQAAWLATRLWRSPRWRSRRRRNAALAFGPLAVTGPVLVVTAIAQKSQAQDWIADIPLSLRLAETGRTFLIGPSQPTDRLWMLSLVPLAYAAVAAAGTRHRRRREVAAAMTTMAAASFLLSVAAVPFFVGRNAIGTVVILTVPVAIGLAARRDAVATLATVALCGIWLVTTVWVGIEPDLQKADWKKLTATIDERMVETDTVVVLGNSLGLPMQRYGLPGSRRLTRRETVAVQEIVLIIHMGESRRCARWVGAVCDVYVWPRLPDAFKGRFEYREGFGVDRFLVRSYRSDAPVKIRTDQFVRPGTGGLLLYVDR
jgi:4-amino-4-deoxy-L-arabinose transferase-like glycosyltransferase